jgi:hypothetical protein
MTAVFCLLPGSSRFFQVQNRVGHRALINRRKSEFFPVFLPGSSRFSQLIENKRFPVRSRCFFHLPHTPYRRKSAFEGGNALLRGTTKVHRND